MAKLTLTDISDFRNQTTTANTINSNNSAIEAALENTLSRDGTTPNTMSADLDMNSNDILNVGTLGVTTANVGTLNATTGDITNLTSTTASIDTLTINDHLYLGPGTPGAIEGPQGPTGPAGPSGSAGPGVATGGTTGQALVKLSNANYDTGWSTVSGSVSDGDKGDIVVSGSGTTWTIDSAILSAFIRTLLDDADAATARTTLGLGSAATSNTSAFEVPLTFSTGLTRTTNTITVNASQNISTLSNLTSNGFVKTSGGTGTLSIDTNTYLTTASATATYQPLDAELTALAGLTSAADSLPYFTGSGTAALTTLSSFMRTHIDDVDAATARTTLGLGTAATQSTSAFEVPLTFSTGLTRTTNTITVAANLSTWNSVTRASGFDTFVATPSSANFASLLTDETGSGTVVFSSAVREKLTAARTYYVRTDGSNSNDGLTNSAGGAFLTIQKAIDVCSTIDANGNTITIQVADGTYTGAVNSAKPWVGTGIVNIVGNTGTPSNVLISTTSNTAFQVSTPNANISISGMKIVTTTSGYAVRATSGGLISIKTGVQFGACASPHIQADFLGIVNLDANYTINGAAAIHWVATAMGQICSQGGKTITISGTPAFSTAFCTSTINGLAYVNGCTFSGTATGVRYIASQGGGIFVNGAGTSYLPGGTAGSATSPGWYG